MRIFKNPTKICGKKVVQDYTEIAKCLSQGEEVYHWEAGDSLKPLINHLEFCLIKPCKPSDVKRGDCVFCKLYDTEQFMVHQVWEISDCGHDGRLWFKIGSTFGTIFGWSCEILGKAYGTDFYQDEEEYFKYVESEISHKT